MLILFPVASLSDEGIRSLDERYGAGARLDAWLGRRERGEIPMDEELPFGQWELLGDLSDAHDVVERMIPALAFSRVDGPAPSDLDERGVCRCGCDASPWPPSSRTDPGP